MGALLIAWRAWDKWLIRGTKFVLFAIGATFTSLITLEVLSRFVFSFSIFFTNAMARYLLVWFFLSITGEEKHALERLHREAEGDVRKAVKSTPYRPAGNFGFRTMNEVP